jgi:hypothetical protein
MSIYLNQRLQASRILSPATWVITYLAKNRRGELRVIKTLREQILNDPKWIPYQDKLRNLP